FSASRAVRSLRTSLRLTSSKSSPGNGFILSSGRENSLMIQIFDHGAVGELRLDRPPANALSPELIAALRAAVESAPGAGAKALVLSGAPGMFSGGRDAPRLIQLARPAIAAAWRDFYGLLRGLAASP